MAATLIPARIKSKPSRILQGVNSNVSWQAKTSWRFSSLHLKNLPFLPRFTSLEPKIVSLRIHSGMCLAHNMFLGSLHYRISYESVLPRCLLAAHG